MNVSARSPQLCLERLQGLRVLLLARHLQSTFAGHIFIPKSLKRKEAPNPTWVTAEEKRAESECWNSPPPTAAAGKHCRAGPSLRERTRAPLTSAQTSGRCRNPATKKNDVENKPGTLTLAVRVEGLPRVSLQGLSVFWQELLGRRLCRNEQEWRNEAHDFHGRTVYNPQKKKLWYLKQHQQQNSGNLTFGHNVQKCT